MTDTTTQQPLRISTDGTAGPYLMLPLGQLDEVKRLLDGRGIKYWAAENAISLNGSPYLVMIDFARDADVAAIQAVLDSHC